MVGRNGPRQARQALGEGARAVGMHQTQDMIRKERPDSQDAEDACGGGGSAGHGCYASGVKVVFADLCVGLASLRVCVVLLGKPLVLWLWAFWFLHLGR